MKKIAICGGHLTPALALIEELQKENDVEIVFFGRKHAAEGTKIQSAEYKLIKEKGIKFTEITTGRLQRKFTRHTPFSLAKIPGGFAQALFHLKREKPAVVVSFGGYVGLPVILSAKLLGIKTVIHEQSAVPGLANRISAKICDKIFISFPKTLKYFPVSKTTLIGNLTRADVYKKQASTKKIGDFILKSKNLIFVTGGNQGSHFINTLLLNSLGKLKDYQILHQVGTLNFKGDYDKAREKSNSNYLPVDYLTNSDFGAAINSAKIVISRSGANTVWELASLSKVAILIPLPISASGEQYENAQILKEAGSAVVLNQKDTTSQVLVSTLGQIETNYQKFQDAAKIQSAKMPRDAAQKLADITLSYT